MGVDKRVLRNINHHVEVHRENDGKLIKVVPWICQVLVNSFYSDGDELQAVDTAPSKEGQAKQHLVRYSI